MLFLMMSFPALFISLENPKFGVSLVLGGLSLGFWGALGNLSRDFLKKHFDMFYYKDPSRFSFQGGLASMLFIIIGAMSFSIILGCIHGPFTTCLAFGLGFLYPVGFMLLRKNVFNESSKHIPEHDSDSSKIYLSLYLLVGWISGMLLFGIASVILNHIIITGFIHYIDLVLLHLCVVIESLILSPDIINRIVPWDNSKKSGFIISIIVLVALEFAFALTVSQIIG